MNKLIARFSSKQKKLKNEVKDGEVIEYYAEFFNEEIHLTHKLKVDTTNPIDAYNEFKSIYKKVSPYKFYIYGIKIEYKDGIAHNLNETTYVSKTYFVGTRMNSAQLLEHFKGENSLSKEDEQKIIDGTIASATLSLQNKALYHPLSSSDQTIEELNKEMTPGQRYKKDLYDLKDFLLISSRYIEQLIDNKDDINVMHFINYLSYPESTSYDIHSDALAYAYYRLYGEEDLNNDVERLEVKQRIHKMKIK